MTEFLRRHSLFFSSLVLLVVSFQLMNASVQDPALARMGGEVVLTGLAPMKKGYHEFLETGRYAWNHYVWLLEVEHERNELRKRIKALESTNSKLVEFERENDRLRKLLDFSRETGYRGVAATVIGRDHASWIQTVTIDRGRRHGLRSGLAVVDGNAIVGQTTVVSDTSSVVLLVEDLSSSIDSIVQETRARGIAEGNIDGGLFLNYVVNEDTVTPGNRVIASGFDGVFPKGTLVGVVTSVAPDDSGLFQKVKVQPSANFSRLENVLVLIPERTTAPESAGDSSKENSLTQSGESSEVAS